MLPANQITVNKTPNFGCDLSNDVFNVILGCHSGSYVRALYTTFRGSFYGIVNSGAEIHISSSWFDNCATCLFTNYFSRTTTSSCSFKNFVVGIHSDTSWEYHRFPIFIGINGGLRHATSTDRLNSSVMYESGFGNWCYIQSPKLNNWNLYKQGPYAFVMSSGPYSTITTINRPELTNSAYTNTTSDLGGRKFNGESYQSGSVWFILR